MVISTKLILLVTLGLICLNFITSASNKNKCSFNLNSPPKNNTQCLDDKSFPGVTCCYLEATDRNDNNKDTTICIPRPTQIVSINPEDIFKAELNELGLDYKNFSCSNHFITMSYVSAIAIVLAFLF